MVQHNYESEQKLATLIRLKVPGLADQRYQNWCRDPYFFRGLPYQWVDFDGAPLAARRLDFSNSETTIEIGNRSARFDSLRPVREWLRSYNGWRRARVEIYHLWPDEPTVPPIENRLQILSSDLQAGRVELRLRLPVEAINAAIPTSYGSRQRIPELPWLESSQRF